MKNEFNLSDKIWNGKESVGEGGDAIDVEDVKEFIKRLKESIRLDDCITKFEMNVTFDIIHGLAGEKLL